MKKSMLSALVLIPAFGWAQSANYTLKAKVSNLNAPSKAYLAYMADGKQVIDSAEIKNGVFQFQGVAASPMQAQLVLDHTGVGIKNLRRGADVLSLYLENGNIMVNSADSVKNAKITGSKINEENAKYEATFAAPVKAMDAINAEYAAGTEEQKKDPAFRSGLQAKYEKAAEEMKTLQNNYIKANPGSFFSLVALQDIAGSSIDVATVEPIFKGLSPEIRNSTAGVEFAKSIDAARATSVGAMAPDFTQNDVNDKPVKLSDFKGKYVLVDFWASWCGPCRGENPNVVKAYNAFKDKNFTVLGVSLDNPGKKDAWLGAIKADGLTWTQVSDLQGWQNAVAKQYGIRSIPQNFLLDPTGKIVAKNLRGEALDKKLEELLGSKSK